MQSQSTKNSARWSADKPFNQLPPMPADDVLCTDAAVAGAENALTALTEARSMTATKVERRTTWRTVPLMEAWASSQIENVLTTPGRMLELRSPDAENNDWATASAIRLQGQVLNLWLNDSEWASTEAAKKICSETKGYQMPLREEPGTVIVGPRGVVYTPPDEPDVIRNALRDLWEQLLEPCEPTVRLIRMAAGHYQFEAIHPFHDGNGRTGRALLVAGIADAKLAETPLCAPSLQILRTRQEYYQRLNNVRQETDWEQWTLYMLRVIEQSTRWCIDRLAESGAQAAQIADQSQQIHTWSTKQRDAAEAAMKLTWTSSRELVSLGFFETTDRALRFLRKLESDGHLKRDEFTTRNRFRAIQTERTWTGQ